jgi:hypothetical protein
MPRKNPPLKVVGSAWIGRSRKSGSGRFFGTGLRVLVVGPRSQAPALISP